jgi:hypothetical protein
MADHGTLPPDAVAQQEVASALSQATFTECVAAPATIPSEGVTAIASTRRLAIV